MTVCSSATVCAMCCRPTCPGPIHEGGELGYSLSHSFGVVLDSPEFVIACVVGAGEAET